MHQFRLAHVRPALTHAAALLAALLLTACAGSGEYFRDAGSAPVTPARSLADWPWQEVWAGVVFSGEKIGFTRMALRPAPDAPGRFDIESEAVIRLRFLGVDKKVHLRARDRVTAELQLERFEYVYQLDTSPMRVTGHVDGRTLHAQIEASGAREDRAFALDAPVLPSSAISLVPALRGFAVPHSHRYTVFNGETLAIAAVEQDVTAYEHSTFFEGPAYKVVTRSLGVETSSWIDALGRPLFELSLHGTMIAALETETQARRYLLEASLSRRDTLLDFSLLRTGPIERSGETVRLEIVLDGVPDTIVPRDDDAQRCTRRGKQLACRIDRGARGSQTDERARFLRASVAAPSNEGTIRTLADSVTRDVASPPARVRAILDWIESNIAREAVDGFTALDVLRERRAECQGHAYLFAALARAAGVPARIVNGLAYSPDHGGFLYHTWNEVWLDDRGWHPVDATFGQFTADATHLRLVDGELPGELVPLLGMPGRASVESVGAIAYH